MRQQQPERRQPRHRSSLRAQDHSRRHATARSPSVCSPTTCPTLMPRLRLWATPSARRTRRTSTRAPLPTPRLPPMRLRSAPPATAQAPRDDAPEEASPNHSPSVSTACSPRSRRRATATSSRGMPMAGPLAFTTQLASSRRSCQSTSSNPVSAASSVSSTSTASPASPADRTRADTTTSSSSRAVRSSASTCDASASRRATIAASSSSDREGRNPTFTP
mmetsp:Transcript_9763/g.26594  ORF Transcript_9763/g.26594 Transcript_9763/m.26594 type:complete len:220 (-) Transcript_9763:212-871(-)